MGELALGVHFLYFYDSMGKDLENTKLITTLTSSYGIDPAFTQSVDFAQHRVNKIWNSTEKIFAVKLWSTRDGKDYVLFVVYEVALQ